MFIYLYYTGVRYFLPSQHFLFFILYLNHFRTFSSDCYTFAEWFVLQCDGRLRSVAPRRPWQASLVPLSSASQLWRHRARAPPTHPLSSRSTWTTRHLVRSPPTRLCLFYFTSRIELVLSHPTLSYVALFDF